LDRHTYGTIIFHLIGALQISNISC